MRKLLFILFIFVFCSRNVNAANVFLGSGSGTITQSGNPANFNPAVDTIFINEPGTYSSISITNLVGFPGGIVKIMPSNWAIGGRVYTSGQFTINGKYFDLGYLSANGFTNTPVLNITTKSSHFKIHNIFASNCQDLIDANSNFAGTYTDTSTYKWYFATLDSLAIDSCSFLGVFSFGAVGDAVPKDIMDSVVITNVLITRTKTNGTELDGIVFRFDCHNWNIKSSYRLLNGDVGAIVGSGNGTFHDIFKNGGVGYISRWILYTMAADTSTAPPAVFKVYNCGQANTSDYGMFDIKNDSTQWSKHIKGASVEGYYCTAFNLGNTINYWSSIFVMGDFYPPYYMKLKYCAGAEQVTHGQAPIVRLQGVTAGVSIDTTGSFYSSNAAVLQIDTTGTFPTLIPASTSPLVNKGASVSYITKDFYGVARPSTPTAGFAQPTPPVAPCIGCIIRKFKTFTKVSS